MRLVTVVGARPQFIKAAVVSRAIKTRPEIDERIVHTGQHYDHRMSQVFFDELGIPPAKYNLEVGSASHGRQTGDMLARLEEILLKERPDLVLVYGDTNSTLAGALAAAKLHIQIAHVEAGLRSYNRAMPEEVNRVVTDHLSNQLFCPTSTAVDNLAAEGIVDGVHLVGDVMYDSSMYFSEAAHNVSRVLQDHDLRPHEYVLLTCHRAENTDEPRRLRAILDAAGRLAEDRPVLFPVHPRTQKKLDKLNVPYHQRLRLIAPLSYLDMLVAERSAALILTDSGGVQKEAFFFGVPCVTLRDETEWSESVDAGANVLAGADRGRILAATRTQLERRQPVPDAAPYYGNGHASERIAACLATCRSDALQPPRSEVPRAALASGTVERM